MLSCKQATHAMSQQQDRPLSWREQFDLKMHLLFCSGCRQFNRQMDLIRQAMQRISGKG